MYRFDRKKLQELSHDQAKSLTLSALIGGQEREILVSALMDKVCHLDEYISICYELQKDLPKEDMDFYCIERAQSDLDVIYSLVSSFYPGFSNEQLEEFFQAHFKVYKESKKGGAADEK